ncbi:TIGR04338 family metallohydrolase [Gordonia jinghuaiqii]|uniref:TIGR04338 family metallohydrolase n=1 Tax=Gordonia jinghuaiqii TaxID=2758710 RepID=A0A7D7R185_9ACTN|nr:TIGR04338 family metallohydrolase [Gordonia jinghuaiqii]MCR5977874.1 TIGR04338 family metallohydrolase [Gordonia jinghuaiqii]QMT02531.1 TIGR04338 family metallohydrolase [Gordonia jinghuaiqii]
MRERDTGRARFYEAEHLVHRLFDTASSSRVVQLAGTELTLPAEARFATIEAIEDYVRRVLDLRGVRASFPGAALPVSVRARRGETSAHYAASVRHSDGVRIGGEIAIPVTGEGRWALRELVVLHELAHHLDGTTGPAHGRGFVLTLVELVGLVLGPEAAFVYRVILADSGVG